MNLDFVTDELRTLRHQFNREGFDLRLVGGVVRDTIAGLPPKDIDLCTDATPAEQIEIYKKHNHRFIETGLQHGTVTVVLSGEPHEITSLRIDVETNGRHAEVEFTRDWIQDLARRDLTINAMSMTFDGELFDPFNGREDLAAKQIRFVGNPVDRIEEDYLRILRYFRFLGRFGTDNFSIIADYIDEPMSKTVSGLKKISRERVWNELKAILKHDSGPRILSLMNKFYVCKHIDMPTYNSNGSLPYICVKDAAQWTKSPELLMLAWCGYQDEVIFKLADDWKWSNDERDHVTWFTKHAFTNADLRKLIAIHDSPREWVAELAGSEERDDWERNALVHWVFPKFPVTGHDLMSVGIKPGPDMGTWINYLKDQWAEIGYPANKEELMVILKEKLNGR